jgi:hypothetical protein
VPSRHGQDLFAGWWQLISGLGGVPRALVWDGEGAIGRWRAGKPELTAECHGDAGRLAALLDPAFLSEAGKGASNVQTKISALARLSQSLRSRPDHGDLPAALGRADIENFLNRLGYLESAGTISRYHLPPEIMAGGRGGFEGVDFLQQVPRGPSS